MSTSDKYLVWAVPNVIEAESTKEAAEKWVKNLLRLSGVGVSVRRLDGNHYTQSSLIRPEIKNLVEFGTVPKLKT